MLRTLDIPIAHIDDAASVDGVLDALRTLHGPDYEFAVGRWAGQTRLLSQPGQVIYRFIIQAEGATIALQPGELVRGHPAEAAYRPLDPPFAEVAGPHIEALWPGDALTLGPERPEGVLLYGQATYFDVITEQTGYRRPRLAMLRHLPDFPRGCAAYPGAFRRETLPPDRESRSSGNPRGSNRINEHTLDMRVDRAPGPGPHHHGTIADASGQVFNHSETAIILPRSAYGLPEVDRPDQGRIRIYRRPAEDPSDQVLIPVRPGSIVVTPATPEQVMGHCFENAFAMLVAIPGFVVPHRAITKGEIQHENR
jgi:hypothetical protein